MRPMRADAGPIVCRRRRAIYRLACRIASVRGRCVARGRTEARVHPPPRAGDAPSTDMTSDSNEGVIASSGPADRCAGRLVIVLSPERSGSTLLAGMLGGHSRVLAPPELFLLRYGSFDDWRARKREALPSLAWLMGQLDVPSGHGDIVARFRDWPMAEVYRWLLRRGGPGRVLVDKTPAYGRDPGILARAETLSPHYLWLVRHPLGVAASWIDRRRERRQGPAAPLYALIPARQRAALLARSDARACRAALERWRQVHGTIADFIGDIDPGRVTRVAYEDLVRSPRPTVESLCQWLDLDFEPAMLEPWRHLPEALAWGIGDGLIRQRTSIDAARAESWRRRLDEGHLDRRTRDLMDHLGIETAE